MWSELKCCGDTIILWRSDCISSVIKYISWKKSTCGGCKITKYICQTSLHTKIGGNIKCSLINVHKHKALNYLQNVKAGQHVFMFKKYHHFELSKDTF